MLPYFRESAGNPHASDHAFGWETSRAVSESALEIARLIDADQDEIVFTSGATEANNLALLGLGKRSAGGARKRILLSAIEHKCILAAALVLTEQYGYQVGHIPVDKRGRVDIDALDALLDEDVLIVSIMAVNNEIGTIQDIPALARRVRSVGALFHCDAAQAPVAMNLSGIAREVDFLSLSAHKMCGPQGIGALYIRRDLHSRIEPLIYGGGQQDGLRSGTIPVALCVGIGAAAALLAAPHAQAARAQLSARRNRFVDRVLSVHADISLNGAGLTDRHPGNANLCFRGYSAHELLNSFQPTLAASSGSACTTGMPEPSHVLKAIGLSGEDADASIRFSLGFETTNEDVDAAVQIIEQVLTDLRATLAHSA